MADTPPPVVNNYTLGEILKDSVRLETTLRTAKYLATADHRNTAERKAQAKEKLEYMLTGLNVIMKEARSLYSL